MTLALTITSSATIAIWAVLVAFAAVAFRSAVRTGTEGMPWANRKPFNCDTCLCFWGALFSSVLTLPLWADWSVPWWSIALVSIVVTGAGMGIAKAILRGTDKSVKLDSSILAESYKSVLERMGEPPIMFEDADAGTEDVRDAENENAVEDGDENAENGHETDVNDFDHIA